MIGFSDTAVCRGTFRVVPRSPGISLAPLGGYGERVAAAHLAADGLILLARNWRCRYGELDLVASQPQPDVLVFCEVKTRRSTRYGPPAAAVSGAKTRRIRRLAVAWMAETGTGGAEVRFDVVSVAVAPGGVVLLEHLRAAF